MADQLQTKPPSTETFILSYPAPHTLLITINRPKQCNSIGYAGHWEADAIFHWFDSEPSLRVAIITGAGDKAFCAGQDLIEQGKLQMLLKSGQEMPPRSTLMHPPTGFMGSRREGKKPIIAAVNGFALGGGFEICLNCDMVVAAPTARFGLPEASRGLYAAAGGLARLVRITGLQFASEVAMTGRVLSAEEALQRGLANKISASRETVVDEAVELGQKIAALSPDAIVVTRHGLREAWEEASVERAAQHTDQRYGVALRNGENIRIGLEAFAKKQSPNWVPSKL